MQDECRQDEWSPGALPLDLVVSYKEKLRTLLLATKKKLGLCTQSYKGKIEHFVG